MFSTMQREWHCIITTFGDSRISINGRSEIKSCQGALKRKGAGPIAWDATNTRMASVQRNKGNQVKFITTISKVSEHLIGFVFRRH